MSLNQTLTTVLFLIQLFLNGQTRDSIPLEPYFHGIEMLIDKRLSEHPQDFDAEKLMAKKENASGEDRVKACFDLFIHYIYKSTELAGQFNDEAYRLSLDIGYKGGYLRASLNRV